jgi:hypothetical protein
MHSTTLLAALAKNTVLVYHEVRQVEVRQVEVRQVEVRQVEVMNI